jgi:DNA-binding response OmpR family regulator
MDELRRKLAGHGASARTILSARGQGYVIADPAVFAEVTELD